MQAFSHVDGRTRCWRRRECPTSPLAPATVLPEARGALSEEGTGLGPPPQRAAGGGAERGSGARGERRPTGTENLHSGGSGCVSPPEPEPQVGAVTVGYVAAPGRRWLAATVLASPPSPFCCARLSCRRRRWSRRGASSVIPLRPPPGKRREEEEKAEAASSSHLLSPFAVQKSVEVPQLQLSTSSSSSPVVAQRLIPIWTPQLPYTCGRRSFCTAAVRSTSLWPALVIGSGSGSCWAGFASFSCAVPLRCRQAQDAPHRGWYAPKGQLRSGLVFCWLRCTSRCLPVFVRPLMLVIMVGMDQKECYVVPCRKTADALQLQFIECRRFPCRGAEAVSHGLDCLDQRDSPVA